MRLTREEWVAHGLQTLAEQGPNALKVGAMATQLAVSRGSFYWHFEDIGDFRDQVLRHWHERATEQVIQHVEGSASPKQRLRVLLRGAFTTDAKTDVLWAAEDAIRAWAARDKRVAKLIASVDERRISYIEQLVASRTRAVFLYWAYLGRQVVRDAKNAQIAVSAIDDVAELFS